MLRFSEHCEYLVKFAISTVSNHYIYCKIKNDHPHNTNISKVYISSKLILQIVHFPSCPTPVRCRTTKAIYNSCLDIYFFPSCPTLSKCRTT